MKSNVWNYKTASVNLYRSLFRQLRVKFIAKKRLINSVNFHARENEQKLSTQKGDRSLPFSGSITNKEKNIDFSPFPLSIKKKLHRPRFLPLLCLCRYKGEHEVKNKKYQHFVLFFILPSV